MLSDEDLQANSLGLLSWDDKDAKCLLSLRVSALWKPLYDLYQLPFHRDMASGTILDLSIEYRMYDILSLLFKDALVQMRQIEAMMRPGNPFTMELVFGEGYASNRRISKTGGRSAFDKALRKIDMSTRFTVSTFEAFWAGATKRRIPAYGHSTFLFGEMVSWGIHPSGPVAHSSTRDPHPLRPQHSCRSLRPCRSCPSKRCRLFFGESSTHPGSGGYLTCSQLHLRLHHPNLVRILSSRPKHHANHQENISRLEMSRRS